MCAVPTPPAVPSGSESTEITAWPTTSLSVARGYVPCVKGSGDNSPPWEAKPGSSESSPTRPISISTAIRLRTPSLSPGS
ncbi:hypothetical protein T484DRAFT_1931086 [Baffinella frigidus]|nr:hypothetical protein T484DRAFT_1931086 [Cryptophyta sp. CCMP2293]